MATIDTSIYQQNPLRTVQQYENDIVAGRQGQQALQQNALALQVGQAGLQDRQRAMQEQDAIRRTVSGLGPNAAPDAQINALRNLGTPAAYAQAESLQNQLLARQKQASDVSKTDAETRKIDIGNRYALLEHGIQALQSATSPQQAQQAVIEGVQKGYWGMQEAQQKAAQIPQDPAEFAQWRDGQLKQVMSAKDAIDAQNKNVTSAETERSNKARESGLARVAAETARHNKVEEDIKKTAEQNKAGENKVLGGKLAFESENKLRDEYQTQSKTFVKVRDSFSKVNVAAKDPTPAGDIALVFAYMKVLDPDSVVREGEYATAANAASIPDRVLNAYNKALRGERLNDNQRADMVNQAKKVYESQKESQDKLTKNYKGLAKNYGLKEENIITDVSLDRSANAPPASPDIQSLLDKYK